jgi:hypothetical protein
VTPEGVLRPPDRSSAEDEKAAPGPSLAEMGPVLWDDYWPRVN